MEDLRRGDDSTFCIVSVFIYSSKSINNLLCIWIISWGVPEEDGDAAVWRGVKPYKGRAVR
jgi:hypothetical protein